MGIFPFSKVHNLSDVLQRADLSPGGAFSGHFPPSACLLGDFLFLVCRRFMPFFRRFFGLLLF